MIKKYFVLMMLILPFAIGANLRDKEYYIERLESIRERFRFCDPSSVRAIDSTFEDLERNQYNADALEQSAGRIAAIARKFQHSDLWPIDRAAKNEIMQTASAMREDADVLREWYQLVAEIHLLNNQTCPPDSLNSSII